jgi:hypothetical protein
MSDPEFIESIECKEISEKLVSKYYPFIGYVNLDLVHFVEMDGYKGKNAPPYIMSGLTQSWARGILQSLGNGKVYCLGVWSDLWEELEQSKKEWIIFRCLYSISPSLDGKIRTFDVQDYGFITEYFVRSGFGPYWMSKEGLPSLLEGSHALSLILPMEDDD